MLLVHGDSARSYTKNKAIVRADHITEAKKQRSDKQGGTDKQNYNLMLAGLRDLVNNPPPRILVADSGGGEHRPRS